MTVSPWEQDVADFWSHADRSRAAETVEEAERLCLDAPDGAAALYELASAHDFVDDEEGAVPLYRRALAAGLDGMRRDEAVIQLASSLRNVGRPEEAVALLESEPVREELVPAAQAFLALALHDAGRCDDALRTALAALAPSLALYQGAITRYADAIGTDEG
ncbi:tetratricopeptide repeat protein [Demequina salsinemoris]|uniref:tetratricopeptide repeat protein n=1 Tax=Demequina salsinemoris TaxID=577470 RepID=UPI00078300EE|nr:tetratricopeptide repeat protein [Demequina salsinemoris]